MQQDEPPNIEVQGELDGIVNSGMAIGIGEGTLGFDKLSIVKEHIYASYERLEIGCDITSCHVIR